MTKELGKTIKNLRTDLELTQKQLAEGICSQSLLSRVEQGLEIPSVLIIHNICQKLGITVDALLSTSELDSPFIQLKKELQELFFSHDFETLYASLHKKTLALFETHSHATHYYFFLGVCELQYKMAPKNSIQAFEQALALNNRHATTHEALISSYLALAYLDDNNEIYALKYLNQCLLYLHKQKEPSEFMPTIYLNIARLYANQSEYLNAIEYIHLGIACCQKQKTTFQLSHLFFELGVLFIQTDRKQNGIRKIKFSIELSSYLDEQFITAQLAKRRKGLY
ncbi:transcriptional regulator [Listeria weihenstephanensis FSL R9-0317]|uniref:Helix-turn-helix transcriptional regulator n=1 Tax=Listeria weihenstephanensis TaxID=1006155 RepID=A0A1S7FRT9_9LIST|nr:helix-turn-helix transcriptional regulator [Listeria weihenstephanensis]AQY50120.1 hypothetical protein UE46_03105 [Listeria weihenstephanensis]EUJ36621.1 transcriptional regulator [Listeria weihenstephanensis FSL R9-0317]MBC1501014.1 helix-turn-helix transcriptional regulator [Listeria weihenstephanensis]